MPALLVWPLFGGERQLARRDQARGIRRRGLETGHATNSIRAGAERGVERCGQLTGFSVLLRRKVRAGLEGFIIGPPTEPAAIWRRQQRNPHVRQGV